MRFLLFVVGCAVVGCAALASLAGCNMASGSLPPPVPPKVTVATPLVSEVRDIDEYTGRVDAMETVTNWDAGGVLPRVSFSTTNHHAQRAGFICEMRGGRLVALTDWVAP